MGDRNAKKELTSDDKDKRKLARRIVRAVQAALEDANHKESELCRRPYEEELLDIEQLLERSALSRRISDASLVLRPSTRDAAAVDSIEAGNGGLLINGVDHTDADAMDQTPDEGIPAVAPVDANEGSMQPEVNTLSNNQAFVGDPANATATDTLKQPSPPNQLTPAPSALVARAQNLPVSSDSSDPPPSDQQVLPHPPPTPPLSTNSHSNSQPQNQPPMTSATIAAPKPAPRLPETPLSLGGVPWYMESFDPFGTSVYEERWTGRDVARGMSEDLTDLSEGELDGLVGPDAEAMDIDGMQPEYVEERRMRLTRSGAREAAAEAKEEEKEAKEEKEEKGKGKDRTKSGKFKKRWRGFR